MKEYQAARKKLESRRLTYDSALSKVQKARKEDSKLEEDLRAAKIRYEESVDEVQQRMFSIRASEANNTQDIANFIDAQADYFARARDVTVQLQESLKENIGRPGELPRVRSLPRINSHMHHDDSVTMLPRRFQSKSTISLVNDQNSSVLQQRNIAPGMTMPESKQSTRSQVHVTADYIPGRSASPQSVRVQSPPLERLSSVPSGPRQHFEKVRANYHFEAEASNELSIHPGDIIQVVEKVSEGWWEGHIMDEMSTRRSRKGLFPANYCSPLITESIQREHVSSSGPNTEHYEGLPNTGRQTSTRPHTGVEGSLRSKPPPPPVPKKKQNLQPSATYGAVR